MKVRTLDLALTLSPNSATIRGRARVRVTTRGRVRTRASPNLSD